MKHTNKIALITGGSRGLGRNTALKLARDGADIILTYRQGKQEGEAVLAEIEPGMKASMAHDLERGNRLELDWLAGKVRALGRELGVPTPASDTVYRVLKLHRMGR